MKKLRAEVVETLLYRYVTQSPSKTHYDKLRQVDHSLLLRCLGWWNRKRDDHTLLYVDPLVKSGSASIEATVCKRQALMVGFVARTGEGHVGKRVMCWGIWLGVRAKPANWRMSR